VVATEPFGTKLCPYTPYAVPAFGPVVGSNQFEFVDPPQVTPLTLPPPP